MATATEVTTRYRQALSVAVEASLKEMLRLLRPLDAGNVDGWWARNAADIEALVADGADVTAKLAARYLRDHARTAGKAVTATLARPAPEQIATSLRVTGPVAFRQQLAISGSEDAARRIMVQRVTGAGRRLILAGARRTTEETVAKSKAIAGYQRRTSGSPCAFCAMLASRGAVYKTDRTAGKGNAFHDNCVVGDTSVQGPRTELAYRRWYEGELIIIASAGGHELAITPKHPVLTDRGWVNADELCQSDRLVHGIDVKSVPLGVPDEDQMPALIQDVWSAHAVDGLASVPVAAEDFHGDGVGTEGYVHVVAPDGLLSAVVHALAGQLHAEPIGAGAGPAPVLHPLLAGGRLGHSLIGADGAPDGSMGRLGYDPPLLSGRALVSSYASLSSSSAMHAGLVEAPGDYGPGHAEPIGHGQYGLPADVGPDGFIWELEPSGFATALQGPRFDTPPLQEQADSLRAKADLGARLLERLAGKVQLSSPVELRRVGGWSGHVYNLQTVEGWYSANNTIVSNCSCTVEPVYSRRSTSAPFAAEWQQAKQLAREQGIRDDVAFRRLIEGRTEVSA